MKKFLLLLLTLIAIALLGYYCTFKMNASSIIEKDISTRSQAALDHQNMTWVNLAIDGRDITLTGTAPSEATKKAADQAVRVFGYNTVQNQLVIDPTNFNSAQSSKLESNPEETKLDSNKSNQPPKQSVFESIVIPPKLTSIEDNKLENNITQAPPFNTDEEVIAKQAENCQRKFNQILKTPIRFKSSSATVQKSSYAVLNKIVLTAKECTHFDIKIHGHTDSSGKAILNKKLSQARANTIMKYLISKEIDDKRLTALGHGSNSPVASNRTKTGRNKNRRIEITVEDKQ